MNFWWVNHKQTHSAEIKGGYLWSPKTNSNGAKNQTYENLTKTSPGDIVFSYAHAKIMAVGVVSETCKEEPKPDEFGKAGETWADTGWYVPITWELLDTPVSPKQNIEKINHLLPEKNSPIQRSGNGNQSCYLASISSELAATLEFLLIEASNEIHGLIDDISEDVICDQIAKKLTADKTLEKTEKEQVVKARRGQGLFRINVEKQEAACRLTKVKAKEMLIASHIKPWRVCTNLERLDGNNGLLLSPHIDKLFDRGWISFTNSGDILVSSEDIIRLGKQWGLNLDMNVGKFSEEQCSYLDFHRNNVFRKIDV